MVSHKYCTLLTVILPINFMAAPENYDISTSRLTGVRSASELRSHILLRHYEVMTRQFKKFFRALPVELLLALQLKDRS